MGKLKKSRLRIELTHIILLDRYSHIKPSRRWHRVVCPTVGANLTARTDECQRKEKMVRDTMTGEREKFAVVFQEFHLIFLIFISFDLFSPGKCAKCASPFFFLPIYVTWRASQVKKRCVYVCPTAHCFFLLLEKTRDAPRIGSHKNETSFLAFEARTVLYTYKHRHCVYIVVVVVVVATDAPTTGTPLRPKQVLLVRVCVCIRARVDFW